MKYIGIDYGTKKIGVAVSDETGSLAFPLTTVKGGEAAVGEVLELINRNEAEAIVIGESKNVAGERNPVMEDIERFAKDIGGLSMLPVHFESEFMTSALAARQFAPEAKSPSGVGRPRASRKANPSHEKLDAAAAALILQSYLDRMKNVK